MHKRDAPSRRVVRLPETLPGRKAETDRVFEGISEGSARQSPGGSLREAREQRVLSHSILSLAPKCILALEYILEQVIRELSRLTATIPVAHDRENWKANDQNQHQHRYVVHVLSVINFDAARQACVSELPQRGRDAQER